LDFYLTYSSIYKKEHKKEAYVFVSLFGAPALFSLKKSTKKEAYALVSLFGAPALFFLKRA
jgi:hypothetical protein